MEEFVKQTLLFDFYGDLLTEHQRRVYEDVVCGDLSFSEAAQDLGVSRQGVHDLVRRCDRQLQEYESKLHLVERFLLIRGSVGEILEKAGALENVVPGNEPQEIMEICRQILGQL